MPKVNTRNTSTAPAEKIWTTLLDCERFPDYMPEVLDVTILENGDDTRRSRWLVLLKGSELEWEEEETLDHGRRRIDFRQLDGDLAYFTGYWQVSEDGDGTVIELDVEFDIGIPMMAEMLNPVAARALEDNSKAILAQLSRAATGDGDTARAL